MTQVEQSDDNTGIWAKFGVLLMAVLVLVGFMLPNVKRWLNAIPNLWNVLYPLLSLFSIYLLVRAFRAKESLLTISKWFILLVSTAAMAAAVYRLGPWLFSVGRTAAVIFIIAELGTYLYDAVR